MMCMRKSCYVGSRYIGIRHQASFVSLWNAQGQRTRRVMFTSYSHPISYEMFYLRIDIVYIYIYVCVWSICYHYHNKSHGFINKLQLFHLSLFWILNLDSSAHRRGKGPISLTIFASQFRCDGNFIFALILILLNRSLHFFHMTRQLWCRGMCKNL